MSEITLLLKRIDSGAPGAAEQLLRLVYGELRQMAGARMAREPAGHTLQPTALVHEAWLRLGGDQQPSWENRRHFFSAAAESMRQILIERARRRRAARHGGGQVRVEAGELERTAMVARDDRVIAVSEALDRMAACDPGKAELVKLRYFVGLTIDEAAESLGISVPTAKRWWAFARAWLAREIHRQDEPGA
ncbi:MAG TPA: ECF-type sigma factor [Opitutus sp.]|nr:ECF-type sigma factor [Opitutus sp.]